jgi:hypothetical protein
MMQFVGWAKARSAVPTRLSATPFCVRFALLSPPYKNQSGTTAVVSISSRASGSTRPVTATSAMAG